MSIKVKTNTAQRLVANIKRAVDAGEIQTWRRVVHEGVDYYTHDTSSDQWLKQAYIQPSINLNGDLSFYVIGVKNITVDQYTFGVYQGRFIQMMIAHFPDDFNEATATSKADIGDLL